VPARRAEEFIEHESSALLSTLRKKATMSDHTFPAHPSRSNGPLPMPIVVVNLVQPETVTDDAIARRAYEKFVARGSAHGRDEEDWATAKAELTAETRGPKR
jgi:hypothetical protein